MIKKIDNDKKVKDILDILDGFYPNPVPPLEHKDAYTLLVAVVLSAQCTDVRVNQVTPKLFSLADNPYDMARLEVEDINAIIRPCGLSPMKSKGISGLSKILVEKHGGEVPASLEALEELPSVGHKTASVVMTQWFGIPAFPVDTHIHRLAHRWGLSPGTSVNKTEEDLKKAIPQERWNKVHLQMIYFGREYCQARSHDWEVCPICKKYLRKELRG